MNARGHRWIPFLAAWGSVLDSPGQVSPIATDGTLGTATEIPSINQNFDILPRYGHRPQDGPNLFFSFARFSVPPAHQATFSPGGATGIERVLARVTGDQISTIEGGLVSTIAGADVYFLNPNGIAFHKGARLDVPGAVAFTTGDFIVLKDGTRFSATSPEPGVLLSASPPASFGFAAPGSGLIEVKDASLAAKPGLGLQLVGSDVTLREGGIVSAPGGRLVIAATRGPAVIPVAGRLPQPSPQDGAVTVIESSIAQATGPSESTTSGELVIRAGRLEVNRSSLHNDTTADRTDGAVTEIEVAREVRLVGPGPRTPDFPFGLTSIQVESHQSLGSGGRLSIQSDSVAIENATVSAVNRGNGGSGEVHINARTIALGGTAVLSAQSLRTASGEAARVILKARERFSMSDNSRISMDTSSSDATSTAPDLRIEAADIDLVGNPEQQVHPAIYVGTFGNAPGGNVHLDASRQVSMTDAAEIVVDTRAAGPAGRTEIAADSLALESGARVTAAATATATGAAGSISILTSGSLAMSSGATIAVSALNSGAGDIHITSSGSLDLADSTISAQGLDGGNLHLSAVERIHVLRSDLTARADGSEASIRGGNISLGSPPPPTSGAPVRPPPEVVVLNRANLVASAPAAQGGNIRIDASGFVPSVDSVIDVTGRTDGFTDLPPFVLEPPPDPPNFQVNYQIPPLFEAISPESLDDFEGYSRIGHRLEAPLAPRRRITFGVSE